MKIRLLFILLILSVPATSQETLSELLKRYNTHSVPYMTAEELAMPKTDAIILDTREPAEYQVSHLKSSIHVGYNIFSLEAFQALIPDRNQNIVVYCSLGIRSEDIGEKLLAAGYTRVWNLYGGIFEWKNKDFKVYDAEGEETENVHVGHEFWGKWLHKGIKIHDE